MSKKFQRVLKWVVAGLVAIAGCGIAVLLGLKRRGTYVSEGEWERSQQAMDDHGATLPQQQGKLHEMGKSSLEEAFESARRRDDPRDLSDAAGLVNSAREEQLKRRPSED